MSAAHALKHEPLQNEPDVTAWLATTPGGGGEAEMGRGGNGEEDAKTLGAAADDKHYSESRALDIEKHEPAGELPGRADKCSSLLYPCS